MESVSTLHIRLVALCLVAILLPMAGATVPSNRPADAPPSETCVEVYVYAVGPACQRPDGLFELTLPDGSKETTHGADPVPPDHDDGNVTSGERQPYCADTWAQHVIYAYPSDKASRYESVVESLRSAVRRMNQQINLDALESGGVTADLRIVCHADFTIRVDAVQIAATDSNFGTIVNSLWNQGFRDIERDYTIFYDGTLSGICGIGHISNDARPGAENDNNRGRDYAVTYSNCWNGRTPLHENGHNQGAVQLSAPGSDGGFHCIEGPDIMCYPPTEDILLLCIGRIRFDCLYDSYFDAEPEPGEYLATHWNIGSRVNRFIEFDALPQIDTADPVAAFTFTVDGHAVSFDASASHDPDGDPLSFAWSFGDETIATGAHVVHTFADPGHYSVRLTVTDGLGGRDSVVQKVFIGLEVPAAVVQFPFEGMIGCAVAAGPVQSIDRCGDAEDTWFEILLDAGVSRLIVRLDWDQADAAGPLFGAEALRYGWTIPPGLPSHSGPAPLVGSDLLDAAGPYHLEGGTARLGVRPAGVSGAVIDQPFHGCMTVLYGDAVAPTDLTC